MKNLFIFNYSDYELRMLSELLCVPGVSGISMVHGDMRICLENDADVNAVEVAVRKIVGERSEVKMEVGNGEG